MADSAPTSPLHSGHDDGRDRRPQKRVTSPLPQLPLSSYSSSPLPPPPPPQVKPRSPLFSFGDQLAKAARRLSMNTSPKQESYLPRSVTASPDLKRSGQQRHSGLEEQILNYGLGNSTSNTGSASSNSNHHNITYFNTNNSYNSNNSSNYSPRDRDAEKDRGKKAKDGKVKEKKPSKLDKLLNLKSRATGASGPMNRLSGSSSTSQLDLSIQLQSPRSPLSPESDSFVASPIDESIVAGVAVLMNPQKSLPGTPPPMPPGKETYWRGLARHSQCSPEDELSTQGPLRPGEAPAMAPKQHHTRDLSRLPPSPPPSQQQPPSKDVPVSSTEGVLAIGEIDHKDTHEYMDAHDNPAVPGHGHQHPSADRTQQLRQPREESRGYWDLYRIASPTPPPPLRDEVLSGVSLPTPPLKQSEVKATTTMSQDLSYLSLSSIQDSAPSIISEDHSLQMEDVFDVYESYSNGPQGPYVGPPKSLWVEESGHSPVATQMPQEVSQYQTAVEQSPLNALERIRQQQRRNTLEQKQLADFEMPAIVGGHGRTDGGVPTSREEPQNNIPVDPNDESAMLDKLLTSIPPSSRPRLPTFQDWQQMYDEQKKKAASVVAKDEPSSGNMFSIGQTSSLGRQNSTGSRHSKEASGGAGNDTETRGANGRRHSMPDIPPGQSREDQFRQRGDRFVNPMLHSNLSSHQLVGSGGSRTTAAGGAYPKRRSGYEDREQQLNQLPIQRQSIAEAPSMRGAPSTNATSDAEVTAITSYIHFGEKKDSKGKNGKRPVDAHRATSPNSPRHGAVSPMGRLGRNDGADSSVDNKDRKRNSALFYDDHPSPITYQDPQTQQQQQPSVSPKYFVNTLLDFTGNRKRSSREILGGLNNGSNYNLAQGRQSPTPLGFWTNLSSTSLATAGTVIASEQTPSQQPYPTFQQQMSTALGGDDKKQQEEREQVLKKLRVMIRNGSIRWTGEFIKAGGPSALLLFCQHVQQTDEKTLAIVEAPVLSTRTKDGTVIAGAPKSKTGFFGASTAASPSSKTKPGQRGRSSSTSIPKPIHYSARPSPTKPGQSALGGRGGEFGFQSSPALAVDQVPTFSNAQAAVNILTAILARKPELRNRILKYAIADLECRSAVNHKRIGERTNRASSRTGHRQSNGDGDGESDGDSIEDDMVEWTYADWISYLKEIVHICGVDTMSPHLLPESSGKITGGKWMHGSKSPPSPGLALSMSPSAGSSSSGNSSGALSIFSLDNIRRRRHSAAASSSSGQGGAGIKYESGEDREVHALLTAHLELASKLIFDMYISLPGIAFAKSLKEAKLDIFLEHLRSECIQSQDLSAQIEDILIQLSMVSTTLIHNSGTANKKNINAHSPQMGKPIISPKEQRRQSQQPPLRPTSPAPESNQSSQRHSLPPFFQPSSVVAEVKRDVRTPTSNLREPRTPSHENQFGLIRDQSSGVPNGATHLVRSSSENQSFKQGTPQYGGARTRKTSTPNSGNSSGTSDTPISISTTAGATGVHRQVSMARNATDMRRERSNSGNTSPLPSTAEWDRRKPSSGLSYSFSEATIADSGLTRTTPTTTTGRRATVGDSTEKSSSVFGHSSSHLPMSTGRMEGNMSPMVPTIPPKSKHRPTSYDAKSGLSNGLSAFKVEDDLADYTANERGSRRLSSPPSSNGSAIHGGRSMVKVKIQSMSTPNQPQQYLRRDLAREERSTPTPTGMSRSSNERVENEPRATGRKSDDKDTFGQGRRASLGNAGQVMQKQNSNEGQDRHLSHQLQGMQYQTNKGQSFHKLNNGDTSTTSSPMPIPGHQGLHHIQQSSIDGSGTSSCSSTTSSGFTAATSLSSMSTSGGSKHIQALGRTTAAKTPKSLLGSTPIENDGRPGSELDHSMLCSTPPSSSSQQQQQQGPRSSPMRSNMNTRELQNLDFDLRIKDDVRRMMTNATAEASHNHSSSTNHRLDIPASDPTVLTAPIQVDAETISRQRDQYLQEQISEIVLPPLEQMKADQGSNMPVIPPKAGSRGSYGYMGNSVHSHPPPSGIPVPAGSSSVGTNHGNYEVEGYSSGIPRPRSGQISSSGGEIGSGMPRRRSVHRPGSAAAMASNSAMMSSSRTASPMPPLPPSSPPLSKPSTTTSSRAPRDDGNALHGNHKAKISERIRMFERQ
ncbi:hypothetical protein BGW38_010879 [Lunasporangiospora selenospora]|uniref:Uncharacterized protein n=1 Tax=Lunasporangiospora selenospora TaxID=979761 RepID=A0A9P6FVL8_9FUNG|nr:hypothetical protein BGW38_010879 [Lunasporangiospora selenospora]